jgi:hypothetical protein
VLAVVFVAAMQDEAEKLLSSSHSRAERNDLPYSISILCCPSPCLPRKYQDNALIVKAQDNVQAEKTT